MNNIAKSITALFTSLEAHLPPEIKALIEMQLTSYFLGRVNVDKFVGSLNPATFAVLATAVDAHRAQKTGG